MLSQVLLHWLSQMLPVSTVPVLLGLSPQMQRMAQGALWPRVRLSFSRVVQSESDDWVELWLLFLSLSRPSLACTC